MKNIHNVFHVFLLKLANEKNDETSSLIWIKDEKQWKIEEIVDKRVKKNKTNYLIKWLEYSHSNNEWMKKKDMSNVKKTIEKFLKSSTTINVSIDVDDETKNFRCIFFKLFFTRFFIIDFNETSKEQEKDVQFFNLFKELSTSSRQNEKTSFWRKRKFASETVCLQRFARREHHFSFSSFSLLLFLFFFFRSSFSFSFSFSFSSRENSNRARSSNEYDSRRRRASSFWRKSENRS